MNLSFTSFTMDESVRRYHDDPATVARLPQLADGLARLAGETIAAESGLLVHHELTAEGQRCLCRLTDSSFHRIWAG